MIRQKDTHGNKLIRLIVYAIIATYHLPFVGEAFFSFFTPLLSQTTYTKDFFFTHFL